MSEHSETASSTESDRGADPEVRVDRPSAVSAPSEPSGPAARPDAVEPAAPVAESDPVGEVEAAVASDPVALAGVGTEQPLSLATVDGSRRRRRTAAVVAAVMVLAAFAGGGAFAATQNWEKPSGMLPEQVVPADVASFARFDLRPGVQQRLAFDGLLGKASGARNSFTGVQRALLAGSGASITLDEAAPWLGDRFGIARWTSPSGPATLLVTLLKDKDKALSTVRAKGPDAAGIVIRDDYALIAFAGKGSQAVADAAAKAPSLAADPVFAGARAGMPEDLPVLGWFDFGRDVRSYGLDADDVGLPRLFNDPKHPLPAANGRLLVGARAEGGGIEVRGRLIGAHDLPYFAAGPPAAAGRLGQLPAGVTAAGVVPGNLGYLGANPTWILFPAAVSSMQGLLDGAGLPPLPSDAESIGTASMVPGYGTIYTGYLGDMRGLLNVSDGPAIEAHEAQRNLDAVAQAAAGAKSVAYATAGPQPSISNAFMDPPGMLVDFELADAAAAAQTQSATAKLAAWSHVTVTARDAHVVMRTGPFAGSATGVLADDPLFRTAMTGADPQATAALFHVGGEAFGIPLKAFGLSTTPDGADTVMVARLVIG
ncbi:hypothetical protein ACFO1B_38775 [Dactylosporangium siamense]|uniref:DUF3352 domain-containing protein n=1 Tax=Dactylosporangium siamense TaxID=685454 RepID=A0A919PW63_9ACTN|nr:hypothetical protein [Dactylosporangium siamense]GIG50376.1 hypothetical protein Dsi01nite_084170 [Dactylosporangium siamense]